MLACPPAYVVRHLQVIGDRLGLVTEAETTILWPPDAKEGASLEKTLMLGRIKDGRSRGRQRMRELEGITDSMDTSLSKIRELVMGLQSTGSQRVGDD